MPKFIRSQWELLEDIGKKTLGHLPGTSSANGITFLSRAEPTRTVAQRYKMDKRYKTRKGEGEHEDRLTHLERKRKAQTRSQASDTDPRPKVSIEATSVHGAYLTQDQRGQDAGQVAQELGYIYSSEQKERPDAEYNCRGHRQAP